MRITISSACFHGELLPEICIFSYANGIFHVLGKRHDGFSAVPRVYEYNARIKGIRFIARKTTNARRYFVSSSVANDAKLQFREEKVFTLLCLVTTIIAVHAHKWNQTKIDFPCSKTRRLMYEKIVAVRFYRPNQLYCRKT